MKHILPIVIASDRRERGNLAFRMEIATSLRSSL
jgi:hypothetical protein